MMFVDAGNWPFVQVIYKRLYVHHIYNLEFQGMLHYKIW